MQCGSAGLIMGLEGTVYMARLLLGCGGDGTRADHGFRQLQNVCVVRIRLRCTAPCQSPMWSIERTYTFSARVYSEQHQH